MTTRLERLLGHLEPECNAQKVMSSYNYDNILVDIQDRVALITFNRPRALNALNKGLLSDLWDCLQKLEASHEVGCVVLTGQGKSFVAGADIKWMNTKDLPTAVRENLISPFDEFYTCKLPMIAAVNGYALGGGCELAMSCDIILASEKAKFGQPEIKLGVIPGGGGTQRLIRQVGKSKAMEIQLTGDPISAQEALAFNLVSRIYKPDELLPAAMKMAHKIASMSLPTAKFVKEAINAADNMPLQQGLNLERKLFHLCFGHKDQSVGMGAFVKKQKPSWVHQ